MNLDRYTNKAQEAVVRAQQIAVEYGHSQIEPIHAAVALVEQKDGVAPEVISKIGPRPQVVLADLKRVLDSRPRVTGSNAQPTISRVMMETFTRAERQAQNMRDEYISTEHLLIGLVDDAAVGPVFQRHGISSDAILRALAEAKGAIA